MQTAIGYSNRFHVLKLQIECCINMILEMKTIINDVFFFCAHSLHSRAENSITALVWKYFPPQFKVTLVQSIFSSNKF